MKKIVMAMVKKEKKGQEKVIGHTGEEGLNAIFSYIRHEETNSANWLADLTNYGMKSDITVLNSGSLRADEIFEGPLTVGSVLSLLPIHDPMVVIKMTGTQVMSILENGVCKAPGLEGRFPCVSGVRFKFNSQLPPGERI
jgi:5'-nucleotidase